MPKKTYYKVVSSYFKSCIVDNPSIAVFYKPYEWVFPQIPHTKLMVFDSYKNAKRFVRKSRNLVIYECEIINPSRHGYILPWYEITTKSVKCISELRKKKKKYSHMCRGPVPDGTVFCDAVKLTKRCIQ